MSAYPITEIDARAIPDSRGNPTIEATVVAGGARGSFAVPSGASRGSREARELRDPDGGVKRALQTIEREIKPALLGCDAADQANVDRTMIELDGTSDKSRLGGNAMIGVSIAVAKAAARAKGVESFEHLRALAAIAPSRATPLLFMNYINGGTHARSPVSLQEHMIVPQTDSVAESLSIAKEVESAIARRIEGAYGSETASRLGDEGGFVIPERDYRVPFELLAGAIADAGYEGSVGIAIDAAASSFFENGAYLLGGARYDAPALHALYRDLAARYSLLSIEDPFAEDAWEDFAALQRDTGAKIVGDDLTVTNAQAITRAARENAIRAVIIKPNQAGTLTETLAAMRAARKKGIECIVSHRSGETSDDFIADLAFAFGCFGLKAGAPRRRERAVKYERLEALSARV